MSSQSVVMGADPGLTGGLAFLDLEGKLVAVYDMPTVGREISYIGIEILLKLTHNPAHAYVEHVTGGALGRTTGAGAFMEGFGMLKATIGLSRIPYTLIAPSKWKKALGLSTDKANSRARAMQLWPNMSHNFTRVKDDGRAEAALIALYGLQNQK